MADVFCTNCGHKNLLGANFCSSCGQPLAQDQDKTTVTFALDSPAPESGEHELGFDLGDIPPGAGMLVVTKGAIAGTRLALTKDVTTAGRHPDSDLFLDDVTVSRRHAEFVRTADGFVVRDAGSLNGTYLNRERVEDAPLSNGDEVQVGKFKLVYFAGPPAP